MTKSYELIGQVFGRLTVLKRVKNNNSGQTRWKCQCSCGNIKIVVGHSLVNGITKSCGCLQKEIVSKQNSLDIGVSARNAVLSSYKNSAKSRGLMFRLSDDEAIKIFQQDCHYCGNKPSNKKKHGNGYYIYNGIDRKNNKVGYTIKNCVPCCKRCNFFQGYNKLFGFSKNYKPNLS